LKKTIHLGAYGWRHKHWLNAFYPDDIPQDEQSEDWLLTYYSNVFDAVLVPAEYWCTNDATGSENWLDDVHENFQFFVECNASLFERISVADWVEQIGKLGPQLQGIVVLDASLDGNVEFGDKLNSLSVPIWGMGSRTIWRQGSTLSSGFFCMENNLLDLRNARYLVDDFVSVSDDASPVTIIVKHHQLQPNDLARFRSVLEIMGHS